MIGVECAKCGIDPDKSSGGGCCCPVVLMLCSCRQFVPVDRPHYHGTYGGGVRV